MRQPNAGDASGTHLAGATIAIEAYRTALSDGDHARCTKLRDDLWHRKTLAEDRSRVEVRAAVAPGIVGIAGRPANLLAQLCLSDLALVRVDEQALGSSTIYSAFRTDAGWQVTDKAWTAPSL